LLLTTKPQQHETQTDQALKHISILITLR